MAADFPLFDPFKALAEIRRETALSAAPELSQKLSQPPAKEKDEQPQCVDPTFATFAIFAGGPDARSLAPTRVKEEVRKNYPLKSCTYARKAHARTVEQDRERTETAKVAKAAKVSLSHSDYAGFPEIGPAKVLGGDLRKWRSALAAMSPERIPCPGYRADEWARTLVRALDFLDTFGQQAIALGWTAPRLFGVHPTAGIVRVDHCGALVLPGPGAVRAITATEVSFGHLTYREKPGQPQGVPVWEFGR
jgi:hypothetical protein